MTAASKNRDPLFPTLLMIELEGSTRGERKQGASNSTAKLKPEEKEQSPKNKLCGCLLLDEEVHAALFVDRYLA